MKDGAQRKKKTEGPRKTEGSRRTERRQDEARAEPASPPSANLQLDLNGYITGWSAGAERLFARSEADAVGQHVSVLFARSNARFPASSLLAAIRRRGRQQVELRLKQEPNRYFDGRLSLVADPEGTRIDCQITIVSERQRAIGALRRSEERLRYALEAASDGLWDWNLKTDRVVFSPRVLEIFGEAPLGDGMRTAHVRTWESRIHPDDDSRRQAALDAHFQDQSPAFESEYRLRTDSGEWKWVVVRGRVTQRDDAGTPLRMIGTITDISERKFAQEALRRSEEQYRNLFAYASDAVILFDPETGAIRDANQKAEQLLGYSARKLKSMSVRDLHPPDQWSRVEAALERSTPEKGSLFEVDGLTRGGRRVPLETTTRLVQYGGEQVYQSFIRDISERRALEDQLRQSQKMETVGRLAGGIAHDFNNLLTAIQGYTTLLQAALPPGSEEREMTEEVFKAVQRASRLTMQLLTFSRREIPNPVPLDLNAIVEEMESMLRRLIGEHLELETRLNPGLGRIQGDRGSIEQVITNLVINAADAMPGGGTLTIETDNIHVEQKESRRFGGAVEGEFVLLLVHDDGQGMDPEILSQIFEPFFTTKPPGTGTGLGLATVYGIVKQSQGHVSVDSAPGAGTTFRIYFPRHSAPRVEESVLESSPSALPGRETVLLVEDEISVRRLTRRFLEISGYKVVEAADVADAVRAAETHAGTIDLLLTDVIMPELSGPELAKRLRRVRPDLKVLYMSGYPGELIARHGVSEAETGYLQKPFSQEALAGKMREVLDGNY